MSLSSRFIDHSRITIKQIQWCPFIIPYMVVSLMCLIVVLGLDCPCWRSIVRSSDTFAGPCALINLILYCRTNGGGTVDPYWRVVLESLRRLEVTATCKVIAHGCSSERSTRESTAIVRGKWPSKNGPGHAGMVIRELLSSNYVPKASGHPTVTFPFDKLW
jgi:hypothetical protein